MALTDQVIMPGSDYQAICDATRTLTGKTATLKSGDISTELGTVTPQTETWVLRLNPPLGSNVGDIFNTTFISKGQTYNQIIITASSDSTIYYLSYGNENNVVYESKNYIWKDYSYQKITFTIPPTGALLAWLRVSGVKQAPDTAVNENDEYIGSVFYLQKYNTIKPNAPYDAMRKITLNITIPEQEKTVSPTETLQTVTPDTEKVLSKVTVNPISTTYVGSGVARKSSSDLTADGATVNVPAGYYENAASKSVATTTQATPSISVNSTGLITASATQSTGYVTSGTKTATKQLPVASASDVLRNVTLNFDSLSGNKAHIKVEFDSGTIGASGYSAGKFIKEDIVSMVDDSVTIPTEDKNFAPSFNNTAPYRCYPSSGKLLSSVTVLRDANLVDSNILLNKKIYGVKGSLVPSHLVRDTLISNGIIKKATTLTIDADFISFSSTTYYRGLFIFPYTYVYFAFGTVGSSCGGMQSQSGGDTFIPGAYSVTKSGSTYRYNWVIAYDSASYLYGLGSCDIYGVI